MAQIFISFVHEDQWVADAVKYLIETELNLKEGVFQSSDKSQVYAGEFWFQKIVDALREAKIVVLLFSKRSIKRPWVNFEAGGAFLTDRTIVPCCYGNQRWDTLPHPYSALQVAHLPEDTHYLLESLHKHLGLTTEQPESPLAKEIRKMLADEDYGRDLRKAVAENLPATYRRLEDALKRFEDEV